MLGDESTLMGLLEAPIETADPVAGAGEEAVRNAAARALSQSNDPRLLPTLLRLAATWHLPGAIEVLGARRCAAALPSMVAALGDDIPGRRRRRRCAPWEKRRLRNFGARQGTRSWDCGEETESSRRR